MSSQPPETSQTESRAAHSQGRPAAVPPEYQKQQSLGFNELLRQVWGVFCQTLPANIDKLMKQGLRRVKVGNDDAAARAKATVAQAASKHADVDIKKQEAVLKRAQAAQAQAGVDAVRADTEEKRAETERRNRRARLEDQRIALDNLQTAISVIRQNGGDVAFDSKQIHQYLKQHGLLPPRPATPAH